MTKTPKKLERYFKGVANHHRIKIVQMVGSNGPMTLFDMSETMKTNLKTTSEHTIRLVKAGLLQKEYRGKYVFHTLTPYGKLMLEIFDKFE